MTEATTPPVTRLDLKRLLYWLGLKFRSQPNCEVKLWYQILVFRILFYAINCKVTTRYTFFCLPTTNNKAVGLSQVWPHIQEVSASPRSYSTLATR